MSDEGIDLGVSPKEMYRDGLMVPEKGAPETVYPTFHYSGPKELELPDEGEMTIHFRKTAQTSRVRKGGEHWYECDIEVHCICDVEDEEPEAPSYRDRSAEEALDAIAAALGRKG